MLAIFGKRLIQCRTLGFLRHNLYSCPQDVKEAAYKGLVRPVLDYGSSVWGSQGVVLQGELESVQKRTSRFVKGYYNYETQTNQTNKTCLLGFANRQSKKDSKNQESIQSTTTPVPEYQPNGKVTKSQQSSQTRAKRSALSLQMATRQQ